MRTINAPEDLTDPLTFRRIYEAHQRDLVSVARRVLHDHDAAEDVVQDVLVNLWLSPASYDSSRGNLRGYLTMIVRHRALDRWRSRVVATAASARLAAQAPSDGAVEDSAADRVMNKETARAVRRAVDTLPASQREAILLTYGGGLSVPEVATATGTPLGTAKSRVRLGLRAAGRRLAAEAA